MILGISYPIPQSLVKLYYRCEPLENFVFKYPEIQHLCAFHNVKELYLIGSAARGQFKEGDDLDFLIDFLTDEHLERNEKFVSFKTSLMEILNQDIDLYDVKYLTEDLIKKGDTTSILLYQKN
ncbi:hypothetical protein JCM31826_07500 [Thermaurantimonas aggregans]|uniref:Polymerase beta nucleotidyltransferase domain-containing protein n=1 Tax=Thermaurantimonas aggregans TaxID=2173829 RepID=A0A401XJS8_9FLAO|nr:nucleotidyltransferase domain-containing protein [Thermaurantimonas aggregans]MCX8148917.1 nucleotidyltransferase domain-containing protein [Thermaurantimonas aggregans]GCD77268.1 hypothetical protein JCM31826_07500 [Thermaurantimonas aggregans]